MIQSRQTIPVMARYTEKNHQLFLKQKTMLAMFLERGAITQAQHDKSLHDLREKMGETD